MKHVDLSRHNILLKHLSSIPRHIVSLHGLDNVSEFVLHDLCHEQCFNLKKAAFFVDNPDFDWLKGIAGFDHAEAYNKSCSIWQEPEQFSTHMKNSVFNQKVRNYSASSMKKNGISDAELAQQIAQEIGMQSPSFSSWDMKHDNHGFLVFESINHNEEQAADDLENGLYLLGLCAIH